MPDSRWLAFLPELSVAVLSVAVAGVLRAALDPILQDHLPYPTFLAAILVAAWLRGLGSSLVALVLGAVVAGQFFVSPRGHLLPTAPEHQWGLVLYFGLGLLIALVSASLRNANLRAQHHAEEALRHRKELAESDDHRQRQEAETRNRLAERRQADRALRESEVRHRVIFEAVMDGIVIFDEHGTIESFSPAAERLFGYSVEEIVGRSVALLLPSPYGEEQQRSLRDYVGTGERQILGEGREVLGQRKDGSTFSMELAVSECYLDGRRIFTAVAHDITRRRQVADEFRRAKEAAEEASRMKSQFLANVSHELRTPMNAILGMTELALDEDLPAEVRSYLETAKNSADSLLGLLNDILDFSRMEVGGFTLEKSLFGLRATVNDAMKALAVRAYQKGLELAWDVAPEVPDRYLGDPLRIRQVLLNLVGNAIKFTERGEIVVRVAVESKTAEEAGLRFAVSDTGIGISEEQQQRIFAPFTQADASTTRHYGGVGLGLAIANNLVQLMDGRLWVESQLGHGSTFFFTVRAALPQQSDWFADSRASAAIGELRGCPVLIVDDSATNRLILEQWLKNWGMQPDAVADGRTALERLRTVPRPYTLVILDALMPGMDGFMLAERIQAESSLTAPTLLMLSSADRQIFAERLKGLPLAAYLEKPISQGELLDTIVRILGDGRKKRNVSKAMAAPRSGDGEMLLDGPTRSLQILLAEDTLANQKLVQSILKKRGHAVEVAANGREAVNLVRQREFDLALMDVQMPIMDGFQATAAIRAMKETQKSCLPIVAMTAHAMRGDRERCLRSGMDAYIAKPVDSRRLIAVVERLARQPGAAPTRWSPPDPTSFAEVEEEQGEKRPAGA